MRHIKVPMLTLLAVLLLAGSTLLPHDLNAPVHAQQKGRPRPAAKPKDRQLVRPPADNAPATTKPESPDNTKQESPPASAASTATANQQRFALVIGNNAYQISPLQNPVNDARLIGDTLRELGFEVFAQENLSRPKMQEAVRAFGRQLTPGSTALFYYAGHGVQVNGRNYLVPTEYGKVETLQDAERELLNAEEVLQTMATKQGLNILILDACRDNGIKLAFKPVDLPGFAEIKKTPAGTFIAYSTSPGKTAPDSEGENSPNSPYSKALAHSLLMRPSRLEDVFIHTRIELDKKSDGGQVPWENSALKTVFFFRPDVVSATPLPNLTYAGPLRAQLLKGLLGGLRQSEFTVFVTNASGRATRQLNGSAKFFVEPQGGALEMVEIPGARFLMGSNAADADAAFTDAKRYDDEVSRDTVTAEMPQHNVDVPGFYMSRYEITQRQWLAVMGRLPQLEEKYRGDDMPVVNISWRDAEEFCARLTRITGRLYRLPSEAEWEYACRAGTNTPYAYGPNITPQIANYNGVAPYGAAAPGLSRKTAQPVGQTGSANAFGLYDMHGNAWEWCADNWHDSYDGAPTDGSMWEEPEDDDEDYHVIRGGSWDSISNSCRSASRRKAATVSANKKIGFRVVVG